MSTPVSVLCLQLFFSSWSVVKSKMAIQNLIRHEEWEFSWEELIPLFPWGLPSFSSHEFLQATELSNNCTLMSMIAGSLHFTSCFFFRVAAASGNAANLYFKRLGLSHLHHPGNPLIWQTSITPLIIRFLSGHDLQSCNGNIMKSSSWVSGCPDAVCLQGGRYDDHMHHNLATSSECSFERVKIMISYKDNQGYMWKCRKRLRDLKFSSQEKFWKMMGCIMTAFLFFFFLIASLTLEAPMRTDALSPDGEYISHHTHNCNNCVKHTISAIELYPCFCAINELEWDSSKLAADWNGLPA